MIVGLLFLTLVSVILIDINSVQATQDFTTRLEGDFNSEMISCNCVAFRLDDIQDHWLNNAQVELIKIFHEERIPLTLSIIGNNFGSDEKLISELNNKVLQNSLFEIANHGWEHEDFTELTEKNQQILLKKTNEKILDFFGSSPKIFIPPFNNFNEETIQAMKTNNMTYLSSSIVKGDGPPFPLKSSDFYRFPETATLGEYTKMDNKFAGVESDIVLERVQQNLGNHGFAVVTMHPQDFSLFQDGMSVNELNVEQIIKLKKLLNKIKESEITFVTIDEINFDSKELEIPQWVKEIAGWWASGQIDDQTYVESIRYLIKQGIIIL